MRIAIYNSLLAKRGEEWFKKNHSESWKEMRKLKRKRVAYYKLLKKK